MSACQTRTGSTEMAGLPTQRHYVTIKQSINLIKTEFAAIYKKIIYSERKAEM